LVSDARSKIVSSAAAGASASKRSRPNACRHRGRVASPTSMHAAGKAFSWMACSSTREADEKTFNAQLEDVADAERRLRRFQDDHLQPLDISKVLGVGREQAEITLDRLRRKPQIVDAKVWISSRLLELCR